MPDRKKPTTTRHGPWVELKTLREKDGHTLITLAQAAGISRSYLGEMENGHRLPTPPIVAKLADALNVPKSMLERERRNVPADDTAAGAA